MNRRKYINWHRTHVLSLVLAVPIALGQHEHPRRPDLPPTCHLTIKVRGGDPASPIDGATVHIESEEQDVDFKKDVPTNNEGIASLPDVPRGKILIQVTATGWKTKGDRKTLLADAATFEIELVREQSTP
jgi:hypothetical protein